MAKINFKDLDVWKLGMSLAKLVYEATASFPESEKYGITSQIRRASVSVPSNIAEGADRASTKDFIRFLNMSLGSLAELETQMLLSKDLTFISEHKTSEIVMQITRIRKMIVSLKKALANKLNATTNYNNSVHLTPNT
jgi:four helix bundle protein